jgi:hypothetical protein
LPQLARFARFTRLGLVAALVLLTLSGCKHLRGGLLWAPETFGFVRISENLFIEQGADEASQALLLDAVAQAENAIRAAYGEVLSRPVVHACLSDECLYRFGGQGTFGKAYANHLLLSRRGMNWHFVAHEWSHAEMLKRLGFLAWREMPQWFDEGFAVVVSKAPEHAEEHWQYLQAHGIAKPSRDELISYKKFSQWQAAGERFHDGKNAERRARGEPEIHSLYAAAGHEVRPWFAREGTVGLRTLIDRLNAGEEFSVVYTKK